MKKTTAKRLRGAKTAVSARVQSERMGKTILTGAVRADWDDPEERAGHAEAALTLRAKDRALIRAFKDFNLDSRNPYHWALLTRHMAEALYGGEPRGRPADWTRTDYLAFMHEVDAVKDGRPKQIPRAVELLRKLQPKRYGKLTPAILKARYYEAMKSYAVEK
ncbi:hypothetical protein ABH975_004198 [Bradyrhizobium ottawaense]|uniref:hypothetical protein n=1 Tax=Bradyrhizobium ottawaense TaxID=931866 RepID=UPI003518F53D